MSAGRNARLSGSPSSRAGGTDMERALRAIGVGFAVGLCAIPLVIVFLSRRNIRNDAKKELE